MSRVLQVMTVVALAVACGSAAPVMHRTAGPTYPPREPACRFKVVGTHPGPGYEEVGTLTIEGDRSFGAGIYHNPDEFANLVRPEVCRVGGDVLLTEVSGYGNIARGVVFRARGESSAPPPPASDVCSPICSPGFQCTNARCLPQCNPGCQTGETCGNDRLCHPAAR